jgi:hypothetical protein
MPDSWTTDITHFLDEHGELIKEPKEARRLAEYFASIIVMASYIEPEYPDKYQVYCRRKPKRKPCRGEIGAYVSPESDEILWMCPQCRDGGAITNWRGTIWDMSDAEEIAH